MGDSSVLCALAHQRFDANFEVMCVYFGLQVLVYLRSDSWDTRIAAGYAIEAIVKQVPSWEPVKPQSTQCRNVTGHCVGTDGQGQIDTQT